MLRINVRMGTVKILNRISSYTLSRLRGNPALSQQAVRAQELHDDLNNALQNSWNAERETMAAISVRDTRRFELEAGLRGLRLAVLTAYHNNRLSAMFRMLFPGGFTATLRGSVAKELRRAQEILVKLSDCQDPVITPAIEVLRGAASTLERAIGDVTRATQAEHEATASLLRAKVRFSAGYAELYSQVSTVLGDWRLAETYFRRTERDRPEDATGGTPPDACGTGANPPSASATASPDSGESETLGQRPAV